MNLAEHGSMPEILEREMNEREGESHIEEEESEARHLRALEVADAGGYEAAKVALEEEGLLEDEILRAHECYGLRLESATWMTPADWEMLAVLDCYDAKTAEHCVNTYLIAKEKTEEMHLAARSLAECIDKEGVALEQFYRACLFHDIGKCCIPRNVLNNTLHDRDWNERLCAEVFENNNAKVLEHMERVMGEPLPAAEGREALLAFLDAHHERAMHFVPISVALSEEDLARTLAAFPDIDPDTATLADVIGKHEAESGKILTEAGSIVEGELASRHHNYDHQELKYPIASGTLTLSVKWEELLKLADMTQALSAARAYKTHWSIPVVCEQLLEEAEHGGVPEAIAALWVKDELAHMDTKELTPEDVAALEHVDQFLAHAEQEIALIEKELATRFTTEAGKAQLSE